jgi:hypothetical protein
MNPSTPVQTPAQTSAQTPPQAQPDSHPHRAPHFQPHHARKRHQLLFPDNLAVPLGQQIKTVEGLRRHLQTAIELEHSTIPTYLCALYSIRDGTNQFAYQTIQSVVVEEMLHMVLACNILNAIGGHPSINHPKFVPEYPTYLPHSDDAFLVPLGKFSRDAIDVFLKIEQPANKFAPPEAHNYQTIGQFYHALKHAIRDLDISTPGGIFTGDVSRQITSEHYYGGGGKLLAVHNRAEALLAINEIVGQGEGINGSIEDSDGWFGEDIEYAHYFKFNEIACERRYVPTDSAHKPPTGPAVEVDWQAVYNMQPNPKLANYAVGSPLWQKTNEFNRTYMLLLKNLHDACNGNPAQMNAAIPLMYDLKYQAQALMQMPIGNGLMAGPSFEYTPL